MTGLRSIRRHGTKKKFVDALDGRKINSVGRKGKYLQLKLDDGNVLVIHLGMSGQLLRAKSSREKMPKHTHVVIVFTQGGQLRYVDPRTFGELFVAAPEALASVSRPSATATSTVLSNHRFDAVGVPRMTGAPSASIA